MPDFTSIPDVNEQSLMEAVRALKQTVETLVSNSEGDWTSEYTNATELANAITATVKKGLINNAGLFDDPALDAIFDRAVKATEDALIAAQLGQAKALNNLNGALTELRRLINDTDQTFTTKVSDLSTTFSDETSAIAGRIETVAVQMENTKARVESDIVARVSETTALAGLIHTVEATVGSHEARLDTVELAYVAGDQALATSIATVSAQVNNLAATDGAVVWQFNNTLDGFTGYGSNQTLSTRPLAMRVTSNSVNPIIYSPNLTNYVDGSKYPYVCARITRVAGSGWNGNCFYFLNGGHGESFSYYKNIPNPNLGIGQSAILLWDMSALTAGGNDWLNSNQIYKIRLDIGGTSADIFDVDWIAICNTGPAQYTASVEVEKIARVAGDNALSALITNLVSVNGDGSIATINGVQIATTSRANAISTATTTAQATADAGTASGFYRLTSVVTPGDGAAAEFSMQVKASGGGSFGNAGMRIQAFSGGTSRIKMWADQFILTDGSGTFVPFAVTSSQIVSQAFTDATYYRGPVASGNMLYNASVERSLVRSGVWTNSGQTVNFGIEYSGAWMPTNQNGIRVNISTTPANGTTTTFSLLPKVAGAYTVEPGKRYEISAYLGAHRTQASVAAFIYDASNNYITEYHSTLLAADTKLGGPNLSTDFYRGFAFFTAPSNARSVGFGFRMWHTGQSDPYIFACRPYFGECGVNQTVPSPWVPGQEDPRQITGAEISTWIANAAIGTAQIGDAQIINAKIADATITNAKIADATIGGVKIANNTIQGTKLIDGTVGGTQIAADTITGSNIAPLTIKATNLLVTGENKVQDPFFDSDEWVIDSGLYFESNNQWGTIGIRRYCVWWDGAGGGPSTARKHLRSRNYIRVAPGQNYRIRAKMWNGSNQNLYLGIDFYNSVGSYVGGNYQSVAPGYSGYFGFGNINPPANAAYGLISIFNNAAGFSNYALCGDISFGQMVGSAFIEDASIINAKIGNLEVDNIKIANGAVSTMVAASAASGYNAVATVTISARSNSKILLSATAGGIVAYSGSGYYSGSVQYLDIMDSGLSTLYSRVQQMIGLSSITYGSGDTGTDTYQYRFSQAAAQYIYVVPYSSSFTFKARGQGEVILTAIELAK